MLTKTNCRKLMRLTSSIQDKAERLTVQMTVSLKYESNMNTCSCICSWTISFLNENSNKLWLKVYVSSYKATFLLELTIENHNYRFSSITSVPLPHEHFPRYRRINFTIWTFSKNDKLCLLTIKKDTIKEQAVLKNILYLLHNTAGFQLFFLWNHLSFNFNHSKCCSGHYSSLLMICEVTS